VRETLVKLLATVIPRLAATNSTVARA